MYVPFSLSTASRSQVVPFSSLPVTIQFTEPPEKNFVVPTTHKKYNSKLLRPSAGGASYSPEYYINIRTGIHYFPKGNATIDPGSNRFKSGLNRIEEKLDEVTKHENIFAFSPRISIICPAILRSPATKLLMWHFSKSSWGIFRSLNWENWKRRLFQQIIHPDANGRRQ